MRKILKNFRGILKKKEKKQGKPEIKQTLDYKVFVQ